MPSSRDRHDDERRAAVRQALGALTGVVPLGVVAVDPEGRIWYQSQRWQDFSGLDDDAARGRPWYLTVHPDDRETVAARWADVFERRGRLGEFRGIGIDGVVRTCRATSVAMVRAGGTIDGYLVVASDAGAPLDDVQTPSALSTPHLLSAVLEHSPDIITILNADGTWRWSSGSAVRLLGHQEGFDPKEGMFGLMHPDDVAGARQALARAIAGEMRPDERLELRLRGADGTWRSMEALLDVLLDEPAIRGVVVHLRDVTDRLRALEELEASSRRLANLVVSMHTPAVLEDEHRLVVLANQAFIDMFRLSSTPEELRGRTLASAGVTPDRRVAEPPDAERIFQRIRASGRRTEGMRFVLVDGRTIEFDFAPVAVNGVNRGHLSTFRDVTDQARAEAERERLLASEREENRRLTEMDVYRSESIAAVSHELRTPLTSIVGYTQLLRSMLDPASSPDELACLDAIVRNVDRLLRLAGDVVALDSLESRALPLPVAPVDVPQAVRQAVHTIAPEASATSIEITVETIPGPTLLGDEDRLGQLLENILSNAVKFTPPEGRVSVVAEPWRNGWRVVVTDSGIGIPEHELEMLFLRFFRASNARRRGIPGTGLGLSVARAIAERHGGTVSVRSVVGVGTTVTVWVGDVSEDDESGSEVSSGEVSSGEVSSGEVSKNDGLGGDEGAESHADGGAKPTLNVQRGAP
jgi:PAS domain S-box-containing protein